MPKQRKRYDAAIKAKVALEAIKGHRTINEIASAYEVHPNQVTQWKKQALEQLPVIFSDGRARADSANEELRNQLYQQIGQLKCELDWLKKKSLDCCTEERRRWIHQEHSNISIARRCDLLSLARSSYYYCATGESEENLLLMRLLDEQYTRTPFYGVRRMIVWLGKAGHAVNPKRVRRLMRLMGLEAIYPKPRLSLGGPGHKIYPYLLSGVPIERINQVWSTDITYIRLRHGFVYLVAVMDWYSRYVLSWEISVTMETSFCIAALDWALRQGKPEIFNTDQGAQFTSCDFTKRLLDEGIQISMDGRGRVFDNIFVERLWRTVKYEDIYLKDYTDVPMLIGGLGDYFSFYNRERPHQSLNYRTPENVHCSGKGRNS
ncbi:MAG TPA: IS3 family transposase [Acidobacteriota bacterium]|nr:IS3 family transposase [Acidobacteriota bacterium]